MRGPPATRAAAAAEAPATELLELGLELESSSSCLRAVAGSWRLEDDSLSDEGAPGPGSGPVPVLRVLLETSVPPPRPDSVCLCVCLSALLLEDEALLLCTRSELGARCTRRFVSAGGGIVMNGDSLAPLWPVISDMPVVSVDGLALVEDEAELAAREAGGGEVDRPAPAPVPAIEVSSSVDCDCSREVAGPGPASRDGRRGVRICDGLRST